MGLWNNGGFFSNVKGHVFKWWQLVIMPVLRINNNSKSNQQMKTKQDKSMVTPTAQNAPDTFVTQSTKDARATASNQTVPVAQQPLTADASPVIEDKTVASEVQHLSQMEPAEPVQSKQDVQSQNGMATEDPMEILRRINEEKEEKRRREIEQAKKKVSEEARIAAIMNANKVDVNAFIEAGKAAKEEIAARKADEKARREAAEEIAKGVQPATAVKAAVDKELEKKRKQEEDLKRAQEIMDRLNREAAEDEAKKQAEIDAAKEEAKKQFG